MTNKTRLVARMNALDAHCDDAGIARPLWGYIGSFDFIQMEPKPCVINTDGGRRMPEVVWETPLTGEAQ